MVKRAKLTLNQEQEQEQEQVEGLEDEIEQAYPSSGITKRQLTYLKFGLAVGLTLAAWLIFKRKLQ